MTTTGWLPLAEYSIKHQVSISTLRRRIKADDIKFRFQDGKYFLLDQQIPKAAQNETKKSAPPAATYRPSLRSEIRSEITAENLNALSTPMMGAAPSGVTQPTPSIKTEAPAGATSALEPGESVISAANKLLTDLKKAYTQVLQEKEEQILNLREEVIDLKTLIKVLESENSRLRERQ